MADTAERTTVETRPSEADFKQAEQEEAKTLPPEAEEEAEKFTVFLVWSQGAESNDLLGVCASMEAAAKVAEAHLLDVRGETDYKGAPWLDRPRMIEQEGVLVERPGAVMHFVQEWELKF